MAMTTRVRAALGRGAFRRLLHLCTLALTAALRLNDWLERAMARRIVTRGASAGARPRIAFFTIVLNGEPWLKMNIDHIYPHAAQIFIVEGATHADGRTHYWDGNATGYCTPEGHSIDNTLQILQQLQAADVEGKIHVITRDQPWNGKTEMCNSFLPLVEADYLWQLDVDEFYKSDDIARIVAYLQEHPTVTAVQFYAKYFFGSLNSIIAGQFGNGPDEWLRIFKYHKDFVWLRHEPPRYGDPATGKTVERLTPLAKEKTKAMDIYMYHYSHVLDESIRFKEQFFNSPGLVTCLRDIRARLQAGECPIEVTLPKLNGFGDLYVVPFTGTHPAPISAHMDDLTRLEIVGAAR